MPGKSLKVMLIEDDSVDAAFVNRSLQRRGDNDLELVNVTCLEDGLDALGGGGFDAIILDLNLPDSQGIATVQRTVYLHQDVPVLVISHGDDEAVNSRVIDVGAQDFIPKSEIDRGRLRRAIDHAIRRKQRETALRDQAWIDDLTGLPTRGLLVDRWDGAIARARRAGSRIGLMLIDLERLRMVENDHGHRYRDRLLQLAGRRITATLRASDTVARTGSGEFTVIVEGVASTADAEVVERKVRNALDVPFEIEGTEIDAEISIGVAVTRPAAAEDIVDVVERAASDRSDRRVTGVTGNVVPLRIVS